MFNSIIDCLAKIGAIISFIFFFLVNPVFGQKVELRYKNFTANHGLPSSQVYQIIQDKQGYIWFGTDAGLVKYNGYEFTTYTIDDGLSTNVVFHLCVDENNRIWCIGNDWKINYFSNGRFFTIDNAFENVHLEKVHSDVQEMIVRNNSISIYVNVKEGHSSIILKRNKAPILTGNKPGVYLYDDELGVHISCVRDLDYPVYYNGDRIDVEVPQDIILGNCLAAVKWNDKIYFSFGNTVFELDLSNQDKHLRTVWVADDRILELEIDREGDIYISCYKNGVWRIRNGDWENGECILSDQSVSNIFIDRDNGIWIGTLYRGLFYCTNQDVKQVVMPDNASVNEVKGYANKVFYLTENADVYVQYESQVRKLESSVESELKESTILKRDDFYFPAHSGSHPLFVDPENDRVEKSLVMGNDYSIMDSGMVCVTRNRINIYSNHHFADRVYLVNAELSCVYYESSNSLLLGTSDGMRELNLKKSFERLSGEVYALLQDSDLEVYRQDVPFFQTKIKDILGVDESLLVYSSATMGCFIEGSDGEDTHLTKNNGIISNSLNRAYYNEGYLVLLSNEGISVLSRSRGIVNYTHENGLLSNSTRDAFIRNDSIWVASEGGVSIFSLLDDSQNSPHQIELTGLRINDQRVKPVNENITLDYSEDMIEFSFQSISYQHEGDLKYRYKLSGIDKNWVETESRTVRYANLPAGEFLFYVRSQNSDKSWSDPQLLFVIQKEKPFWQQWWFWFLVLILVLSVLFFIGYLFLRRQKKIQRDKLNLLDLERKILQAQMNPHFIFNALSSLQNLILKDRKEESQLFLLNFSRLTRLSLNHSSQNAVMISEEISYLKLYMDLEKIRFGNNFNYHLEVDLPTDDWFIPPMLVQPFVENSIIHGFSEKKSGGYLLIKLTLTTDHTIKCVVEDNGRGREGEITSLTKTNSMGIGLIKDRLKTFDITDGIKIIDLKDKDLPIGTRIEIIIPFKKYKNEGFSS